MPLDFAADGAFVAVKLFGDFGDGAVAGQVLDMVPFVLGQLCSPWQSFLQERPYATAYWPFSVRESCTSNANPPCVELWGPLAENEMFTFAPYPFISGSMTLDAIRKPDLFINFDIVRQMKEPEILTTRDLLRKGWGI